MEKVNIMLEYCIIFELCHKNRDIIIIQLLVLSPIAVRCLKLALDPHFVIVNSEDSCNKYDFHMSWLFLNSSLSSKHKSASQKMIF